MVFGIISSGYSLTNIADCGEPYSANTPGETYELTGDLSTIYTCIEVKADNVVIDCRGYSIIGDFDTTSYGIDVTGYDGVTIKNCDIKNFSNNINFQNSNYNLVNNNNLTLPNYNQIRLSNSSYDNFTNNFFDDYAYNGALIRNYLSGTSNNGIFDNNRVNHSNYYLINVVSDSNWTFTNNYFYNTTYLYPGYNTLIENNTFDITGDGDEFIYRYKGGIIRNNVFKNNPYGAIQLDSNVLDTNSIIEGNTFINLSEGVDLSMYFADARIFGDNTFINTPFLVYTLNGAIYVNSDVTFPTTNFNLQDSGNDGSIIINASDITLDCNGANFVNNVSNNGYALYINGQDGVTIDNCNIYGYGGSQNYANNASNLTIQNSYFAPSNRNYWFNMIDTYDLLFDNNILDGRLVSEVGGLEALRGSGSIQNSEFYNQNYDYNKFANFDSITIKNNLFNSTTYTLEFPNTEYALVENNIFRYTGKNSNFINYFPNSTINIKNNIFENNPSGIFDAGNNYFVLYGQKFNLYTNIYRNIYRLFTDVDDVLLNIYNTQVLDNVTYIVYDTSSATVWINDDITLPRGNYVMYDTDNDGAFIINKSGITFDCNGANITGGGSGSGIYLLPNIEDITIINCNIHNYTRPIYFSGTGQILPHHIYNNLFNCSSLEDDDEYFDFNYFNNSVIGNFWANPSGTGFSQTCEDGNLDGICDLVLTIWLNWKDYLPLAIVPTLNISSISNPGVSYILPTPSNNAKTNSRTHVINVSFGSQVVTNCQLNLDNGTTIDMTETVTNCYTTLTLTNSSSITSYNYNVSYNIDINTYSLSNRQITYYPSSIFTSSSSSSVPSFGIGSLIAVLFLLVLFI